MGFELDINAPRNAPLLDPVAHIGAVSWHSWLFQYELAMSSPVDVAITHSALATKNTWHVVSLTGIIVGPGGPSGSSIGFLVQGDTRTTDILLYTHGLPYVPKFMVSLDGRRVPDGFCMQIDARGGHRRVSVFATATGIYLRESAVSTDIDLVAAAKTYRVMVFRTRAPDVLQPMFAKVGAVLSIARGIINSSRRYLRRTGVGDSPFAFNLGPTIDIKNGGARSMTGGVTVDEPRYSGTMAAPSFVSVGV